LQTSPRLTLASGGLSRAAAGTEQSDPIRECTGWRRKDRLLPSYCTEIRRLSRCEMRLPVVVRGIYSRTRVAEMAPPQVSGPGAPCKSWANPRTHLENIEGRQLCRFQYKTADFSSPGWYFSNWDGRKKAKFSSAKESGTPAETPFEPFLRGPFSDPSFTLLWRADGSNMR